MASNKLLKHITKNSTAYLTFFLLLVLIVISLKFNREGFVQGGELILDDLVPQGLKGGKGPDGLQGPRGDPGDPGDRGSPGNNHLNIIRNDQGIQALFGLTSEDLEDHIDIRDKIVTHIVDQILEKINEDSNHLRVFEDLIFRQLESLITLPTVPAATPVNVEKKIKAGTIIAWHMPNINPPEDEWQLCDGSALRTQEGDRVDDYMVPDLTGRFILGGGYRTNLDNDVMGPETVSSRLPGGMFGHFQSSTLHKDRFPGADSTQTLSGGGLKRKQQSERSVGKYNEFTARNPTSAFKVINGGAYCRLNSINIPIHSHTYQAPNQARNYEWCCDEACTAGSDKCRVSINFSQTPQITGSFGKGSPDKFDIKPPFLNLKHFIKKPKDRNEFICDYVDPHENGDRSDGSCG